MAIFLSVWWCIGACVTTFVGPHSGPQLSANGYFSCWIALGFSLSFLNVVLHYAPADLLGRVAPSGGGSPASRRFLAYLSVCALALVFAALHVVFGSMEGELAPLLAAGDAAATAHAPPPSPGGSGSPTSCSEYGGAGAAIWALMVGCVTLRDAVVLFAQRASPGDASRSRP